MMPRIIGETARCAGGDRAVLIWPDGWTLRDAAVPRRDHHAGNRREESVRHDEKRGQCLTYRRDGNNTLTLTQVRTPAGPDSNPVTITLTREE